MSEKIKLALLWHMHQPFYQDPLTGWVEMPWVRLHALKDYWGMVTVLENFPRAHVTFNLVPSLLVQLEDLLANPEIDPLFSLAFCPAASLTDDQKSLMLGNFFQVNHSCQLARFPRFEELYQRVHYPSTSSSISPIRLFNTQDLLDLQVLSQLCWFDEIYLETDAAIRALTEKGQHFTEEDKVILREKEMELLSRVIPTYRRAEERGQIEISTSPFFHPILPLLCDSTIASQSQPRSPFPSRPFRYPEDASLQIDRATHQHLKLFGHAPAGLWPSEGSVSTDALELISAAGFRWTATDEGILARSLNVGFPRNPHGEILHSEMLHSPYQYRSTGLSIFFRDRELSDAIGFVYSRMPTKDAVDNFTQRMKSSVKLSQDPVACVSIILDGENAWEHFPENGRPFLKGLYQRLSEDPDIEMVTFSEACDQLGPRRRRLDHIWPGSWINSDFSVWIGDPEDNQAWELLTEAREALGDYLNSPAASAHSPRVQAAWKSLLAAEGSDWCWWYGPEHSTVNDLRFDRLFRSHLINCYQQLGLSVPPSLAQPLKRQIPKRLHILPSGWIHPTIEGCVSSYFEWIGAGTIEESQTTMHHGRKCFERVLYGWDADEVFLRIDFPDALLENPEPIDVRVYFDPNHCLVFQHATNRHSPISAFLRDESNATEKIIEAPEAEASFSKILEARIRKSLWPSPQNAPLTFYVLLELGGVPVERIPAHGYLTVDDGILE